jgi:outer membrane receptor protein involved in Fe transport
MRRGLIQAWIIAAVGSVCWAQAVRATLVGRVTDQTGAVVPGAKVTLVNSGTNETHSAVVGDNAEYVFTQLAPGQYTLTTEHEGFRKDVRSGLTLEVGQQARIDVALQVGALSEQVEVTAAAPLISSENAAIGNVVDQKKIVELPLNGRGYLQLAFLQPGVYAPAQASTIGFRGGMNIAGSNEVSTQYILDGVDNNDEASNQPLHTPVLDAVQEFRVLTGTYSAEYGRQSGGQVIVTTKSGTNEFHGTAWDFYRNSVLDARNFFAPQKLSFIRNQYGTTIGGPIRRNQTFFFGSWENQNRGNGVTSLALVPSVDFRNGNFSALSTPLRNPFGGGTFNGNQIPQSLWSKQGAGLLALFPLPNLNSTQNNIVSSSKGHYDSDQFSIRVDHRFGDKDQIYGAYQFADSHEFYPLSNPLCSARSVSGWGCNETQRTQQATAGWTHIFTPNLVNEARVGYIRFGFYRIQQDSTVDVVHALGIGGLTDAGVTPFNNGAPQITMTGYVTIGGATNLPQGRHDNNYNYIENMTWTKGSHTMKWGVDYLHILFNSFFTSNGRGAFTFQNTFTGNAVADLLLGLPQSATRNPGTPFHNAIADNYGIYFQDDWKVTPKLTVNFGLRWDVDLPARERVDKIASFDPITNTLKDAQGFRWTIQNGLLTPTPDPSLKGAQMWNTDWNNFGPRVGIAWRPFGGTKTVIRSGFGSFYNHQITGNGITPLNRNSPYRNSQTAGPFSATSSPLPNLANAFSGNPSATPPGISQNFRTAYTNEWSFGIQRELASNLLVEVSYVGNESHDLPTVWNINQAFPGTVGSVQSRRPYQPWGNITGGFISSIGNANYNGLQARLERRFAKGLSFVASYSWSKAIDTGANISTGSDSSNSAQDARNLRAERGLADFNVAQRFVGSFVWDLPGTTKANKVLNFIVSGWQLKGILTAQEGQPFTLYDGLDQSSTGANNDRPNVIGDWHVSDPGVNGWFNTCTILANGNRSNCKSGQNPAWQIAPAGTFGNAGRNILIGPGLLNFDTGLSRQFRLSERFALQFRGELFNVLNRANFFLPNRSVSSSALGSITQAADQPNTGAQRQIQFAMKIVF